MGFTVTIAKREDTSVGTVRYEKAETLLRLILDLQGTGGGLTLGDIQERYRVSRRTAERMREAVERLFPQLEEVCPGEIPKRWRLPPGTAARLAAITAEDLANLRAAAELMRRENLTGQAKLLEGLAAKVQALIPRRTALRVETDLEALIEAEGFAVRPGPRPRVREGVLSALREGLIACRKVRLHYRARGTGRLSRQLVCPYGLLYGSRHYLVAYSMGMRGYRLYSLPDIDRAAVTEWPFQRDPEFSLTAYAERSFGVFQEEPFDVVWRFSPEAPDAREHLFHPTQTLEVEPDGSLLLRFRAGGAREMCWHLFKWGDAVTIVAPESLRETYRELLEIAAKPLPSPRSGARRKRRNRANGAG